MLTSVGSELTTVDVGTTIGTTPTKEHGMSKLISTESPEYMATLTTAQLRTLAASKRPEHLVAGFAAGCELILRDAK